MKANFLFFIFILSFFLASCAREIHLKNMKFYDSQNRQITFHGTNVVVKTYPYIPDTGNYNSQNSFGPEDIQNLKENGFNAIRLGVMWAGVERQKDTFDQQYLAKMVKIVNNAGKAGIYTLVQYHQDLLSESFCGDGVPTWLVDELKLDKTFPFPMGNKKGKLTCGQNWSKYYFSYDVGLGFNYLYNPNHKLNKKFVAYWEKVVQAFKGNQYVIAYQLINQPWVGNLWRDPVLIIPSMAQRLKLQSLYDQLSLKIRAIDPQTPLCFQPVTFDNFVPSGFSHPPGGNKYKNSSIFCYHHYQPPAINLTSLDTFVKDAQKLGISSLLSETYGTPETLDRAQYWRQSWMYWIYKDFGNDQIYTKNKNKISVNKTLDVILRDKNIEMDNHLIRTYFQRVAGQLIQSRFNSTTGHFTGTYWATLEGQTVLFLAKQRIYNNNYVINVYPQNETSFTQDGNFVFIKYVGKQENKKILVTVFKI